MRNTRNSLKVLGGLFLSMLLLFVVVASAEETHVDGTHATVASAGAQATATGSEAIASTKVVVTSEGASASSIAKAKAENGETATAIADAWARWVDGSSAYAHSAATAVAGIGETIWAEAKATASASAGSANAGTIAYVGTDPNYVDPPNNGGVPNNGKIIPVVTSRPDAISGFIFGKSDLDRYCTYKLQLTDDNPGNNHRAEYYLHIIAWDYGFDDLINFESKYNVKCETKD